MGRRHKPKLSVIANVICAVAMLYPTVAGADVLTLRSKVTVSAGVVTLGDFVTDCADPELKRLKVLSSPRWGQTRVIRRLEIEVSEKLGAKVSVDHTANGAGQIVIKYNSLDELDGILKHIR